jgi:hypothetical protein
MKFSPGPPIMMEELVFFWFFFLKAWLPQLYFGFVFACVDLFGGESHKMKTVSRGFLKGKGVRDQGIHS